MAWTKYQFFLAGMMLITGAINTLSTNWADTTSAPGCTSSGLEYEKSRKFDHPYLQSVGMFVGEFSCLLVFKLIFCVWKYRQNSGKETSAGVDTLVDGNQQFSPLVFWPAALCDMFGTTLMYIGLNMTDPSSFQMLRGAVIVFTALLSVTFLQRTIKKHMWLGILFVVAGLIVVGVGDFVYPSGSKSAQTDTNLVITGDLLVVMAQIVAASQMVYEEKFVYKYNIAPLQAVGWEGFFGFCTLSVLLVPMYFIQFGGPGVFTSDPMGRMENAIDAFCQIGNSVTIPIAQIGNILSIAFFNFSGISVTRELSATTRMVLDSLRTVIVWAVSIGVGWQQFNWIQIPGFLLLTLGTAVYNGLLNGLWRRITSRSGDSGETEPLIN